MVLADYVSESVEGLQQRVEVGGGWGWLSRALDMLYLTRIRSIQQIEWSLLPLSILLVRYTSQSAVIWWGS